MHILQTTLSITELLTRVYSAVQNLGNGFLFSPQNLQKYVEKTTISKTTENQKFRFVSRFYGYLSNFFPKK